MSKAMEMIERVQAREDAFYIVGVFQRYGRTGTC